MDEGGGEVPSGHSENPTTEAAGGVDNSQNTTQSYPEALIDFLEDTDQSKSGPADEITADNEPRTEDPNPEEKPAEEERLCGWLQLRSRGIGNLKVNRNRWFLYVEDNCKLYIYR